MIYPYQCEKCDSYQEIIKPHSLYNKKEFCHKCKSILVRLFLPPQIKKMYRAEYNPGLGCIVKNENHKKDLLKKHNLIEIGNEPSRNLEKLAANTMETKRQKNWKQAKHEAMEASREY